MRFLVLTVAAGNGYKTHVKKQLGKVVFDSSLMEW